MVVEASVVASAADVAVIVSPLTGSVFASIDGIRVYPPVRDVETVESSLCDLIEIGERLVAEARQRLAEVAP